MSKEETNPGWAAGIGQRSRIQQLAWAVTGAPIRKKDLRLNTLSAIAEGRKLRDRLTAIMQQADADPADARVYCVFVDPGVFAEPDIENDPELSALDAVYTPRVARLTVASGASDMNLINALTGLVPTGFLIFVWDRNAWPRNTNGVIWTIRPLMVEGSPGTTATGLNAFAMRSEKLRIELKLRETGGVLSDNED